MSRASRRSAPRVSGYGSSRVTTIRVSTPTVSRSTSGGSDNSNDQPYSGAETVTTPSGGTKTLTGSGKFTERDAQGNIITQYNINEQNEFNRRLSEITQVREQQAITKAKREFMDSPELQNYKNALIIETLRKQKALREQKQQAPGQPNYLRGVTQEDKNVTDNITSYEDYLKRKEKENPYLLNRVVNPALTSATDFFKSAEQKAIRVPTVGAYLAFATGIPKGFIGGAKSLYNLDKTVQGVAYAITNPYQVGYSFGEQLMTRPTGLAGEMVGYYAFGKALGYGATKLKKYVVSKSAEVKTIQKGETEVLRAVNKDTNQFLETSGVEGKVEVYTKIGGKTFKPKQYDIMATSEKSMKLGESTYSYTTDVLVKSDKLDIYSGVGQGSIGIEKTGSLSQNTYILGQSVPSEITTFYSVTGKEVGTLSKVGSFKGVTPLDFTSESITLRQAYAGEMVQSITPQYTIYQAGKEAGVVYKGEYTFTGDSFNKFDLDITPSGVYSGTAKTDYILTSRQALPEFKGSTGETRAVTDYSITGTPKVIAEFGTGEVKGSVYPEVVPKQDAPIIFLDKAGIKQLLQSKKGQAQLSPPTTLEPTLEPTLTVPQGVIPRPGTTLFGEALESARLSYISSVQPISIVPVPPTISVTPETTSRLSFSLTPDSGTVFKPDIKPIQRPDVDTAIKNFQEPVIRTEPEQLIKPVSGTGSGTRLVERPAYVPELLLRPESPFIPPFTPDVPVVIPPFYIPPKQDTVNVSGFDVLVRRKGIFRRVSTQPTLKRAVAVGKTNIFSTAGASFKIVPREGGGVSREVRGLLSNKFYESRREPGVFIQKRQFRISSPGEKREITYKGLLTQRARKKNKGVFNLFRR